MVEPRRRDVNFESIDDVIADVQRLAAGPVETTGNYSFEQILEHLARTLDTVTGQTTGPRVAWPIRAVARLIRPWLLSRPLRPGFKLPAAAQSFLWPDTALDRDQAMAHFLAAIERYKDAPGLPPHPIFGAMTRAQSDQLQCKHCALHLSFVHSSSDDPRGAG